MLAAESNLPAHKRMMELAGDAKRIVPGHDPGGGETVPGSNGGVVKVE
jgi:hypothetical protein